MARTKHYKWPGLEPGILDACSPKQRDILLALDRHKGNYAAVSEEMDLHRSYPRMAHKAALRKLEAKGVHVEPEIPLAHRQEQRLKDQIADLRRKLRESDRELNATEDFRQTIFGLGEPMPLIEHPLSAKKGEKAPEIPILFTSDFQWGEVIKREEMGGTNEYNRHIAADRYKRLIEAAIRCAKLNSDNPPPMLYYLRGGDAISGSIHEELAETNDLSSIPAVQDLCQHERWGIETLSEELGCHVRVVSVPGNHDRTTKRPRHKGYVETSFDSIISWHLEMCFAGDDRFSFFSPAQNDAYFQIYDQNFVLTHGDMMGTGGGQGYIGPVAPITKGHRKVVESYLQEGKQVDYVLTGHYHTSVETEYGFGNGCLPGPSEYSRLKIRAKPSPPTQWMLFVDKDHGITVRRKLMVAAPGEGDLYD